MDVGVTEALAVGLALLPPAVITNWGAFAPISRLARLTAVLLLSVRAKLTLPLPLMKGVISTVVQTPPLKEAIEPARLPNGGALL